MVEYNLLVTDVGFVIASMVGALLLLMLSHFFYRRENKIFNKLGFRISITGSLSLFVCAIILIVDILLESFVSLDYFEHLLFFTLIISLAISSELILTEAISKLLLKFDHESCNILEFTDQYVQYYIRLIVFLFYTLIVLEYFDFPSVPLLMFQGSALFAFGWASKELLSAFFAGVILFMDRPFKLNEYIHIPHLNITGKVSKMSLRVTEVLPEKGYPILIDNNEFNTHPVINLSRRDQVFVFSILMIDLSEKNQLRSILQKAQKVLSDKDSSYPDGWLKLLSIDNACFKVMMGMTVPMGKANFFHEEAKVRDQVNKAIIKLSKEVGFEFAYPTEIFISDNKK